MLAVVHVLATGLLGVQVMAAELGITMSATNEVISVTGTRTPGLPLLGIAAVGAAVYGFVAALPRRRAPGVRLGLLGGFLVVGTALCLWSFTITTDASQMPAPVDLAGGWQGWIQHGGENSAVHLLLVIALAALVPAVRALIADRRAPEPQGRPAGASARG